MKSVLPILLLACGLSIGAAAEANAFEDPDWPCVQRKVQHLSWGQMWSGPPLPEEPAWRDHPEIAPLIAVLTARRTEVAAAGPMLDALEPPVEDAALVALFAEVLDRIDRERSRIIDGIVKYSLKQRALSERIDARRLEIDALRAETANDDFDALDRIEEMEDALAWDTRIYVERQRSLTYVCESPVILEKRAFAAAHLIQQRLQAK